MPRIYNHFERLTAEEKKERIQRVCDVIRGIMDGQLLRIALEANSISNADFFEVINSSYELENYYSRAQQSRAEIYAEEIIDIADLEPDPNKARVRVDARKWYASKAAPKKYGDRIDLNVNGTIDIAGALSDARKRALPADFQVMDDDSQDSEITKLIEEAQTDRQSVMAAEPEQSEDDEDLQISEIIGEN